MNDDTEKLMAEAKARLGLDSVRCYDGARASSYIWCEAYVAGHKFLAFGNTPGEALAKVERKIREGESTEFSKLRADAGDILDEAKRRADELDQSAKEVSARVRADIAAAKLPKGVVS